ncbi:MAG: L,D-transpeptidase [Actinomycetota bacterium]
MVKRRFAGWLILTALLAGTAPAVQAAAPVGQVSAAGRFVSKADIPAAVALGAGPNDTLVADSAVGEVSIYESQFDREPADTMSNPTHEGVLLLFSVLKQEGNWLEVRLPKRPNGSTGWIKTSDVRIRKVPNRIVIDRSDNTLQALRGEEVLLEASVGVGLDSTPTPLGQFYVDISVPFQDTGGPYGAYMLSVAGYSEVLTNFGGGNGQIAIHGTNNRGSVGIQSSNGCLRMYNEDILELKELAPTGTPVEIVA